MQLQVPTPPTCLFIKLNQKHLRGVISILSLWGRPPQPQNSKTYPPNDTFSQSGFQAVKMVIQSQIPTAATFFFIILFHPHPGGIISPSRALGAPTTAPKQPAVPSKWPTFPITVFKWLKWCHATTNTYTRPIVLHHTSSCSSRWGNFLIKGPKQPNIHPKMTHFPYQVFKQK